MAPKVVPATVPETQTGNEGSVSTSPDERVPANSAKLTPVGAGEYARGSSSWLQASLAQHAQQRTPATCAVRFMCQVSHASHVFA